QIADADRKWKLRASSYFQREVTQTFACTNVPRACTRCDLPCGLHQRRRTTADVDFNTKRQGAGRAERACSTASTERPARMYGPRKCPFIEADVPLRPGEIVRCPRRL